MSTTHSLPSARAALAGRVVQIAHDFDHVGYSGGHLDVVVALCVNTEERGDPVRICVVPGLVDQVDELAPPIP
jgi:hypothetical protein